jgi:hypothetical protein
MDKEQVPQDKNYDNDKNFKTVIYALDKDGNYTTVASDGWEPENLAQKQAWDAINEAIENIKIRVIAGELSPIAYYIEKNQYSFRRLAHLTGLSKRNIRKHLSPKAFAKIDSKTIGIYSQAFKVPVEQILQPF